MGTKNGQIYVIHYSLERTENYRIKERYKIDVPSPTGEGMEPFWFIYGSVTIYDHQQKIIASIPLDTSFQAGHNYADSLKSSYSRIFKTVKEKYPDLDFFTPSYISFCEYQTECEKVSVLYDTITSTNIVVYKKKNYPVPIFSDSTFLNPQVNPYHQERIDYMRISSVRIYKNKSMEIVLLHMITGDYTYFYTSDKKLAGTTNEDGNEYILSNEYKPDFTFKTIENGTYAEPVFHHGYGLDLFIVK